VCSCMLVNAGVCLGECWCVFVNVVCWNGLLCVCVMECVVCRCMMVYVTMCFCMLVCVGVCWYMLVYVGVCSYS